MKVMLEDAKHPGKVGRHQTMINTALSHLLEGSRGVVALQWNYLAIKKKEGGERETTSQKCNALVIEMFSKATKPA